MKAKNALTSLCTSPVTLDINHDTEEVHNNNSSEESDSDDGINIIDDREIVIYLPFEPFDDLV